MISNIASATPAIPAENSILGSASSQDSTSSFADQLANAVSQSGSSPLLGGGTPANTGAQSQNSDAPAGSPVQFSFFQYLIDTPTAAAASPTVMPSSAAGVKAGADPSIGNTAWLSPPYYTPPAPTFVTWENPPGVMNTTASPETDLQNLAAQFINDPTQFVWGGVPATTPQDLVQNFVNYAQSRAAEFPQATPAGYDPVAMGTKYANLVMDSIQKIPYDTIGSSSFASVYDAWVAGVNDFPGAGATAGGAAGGNASTVS